jgi:hypothetical protein
MLLWAAFDLVGARRRAPQGNPVLDRSADGSERQVIVKE